MNDLIIIENKIHEIRGQKVMLDFDLARIYGYTTKRFNEQVKRNIEKFPEDFMFQLTDEEVKWLMTNLRSQIVTSSWGGTRYAPLAFTEQGVAMLSGLLRSPQAIEKNLCHLNQSYS
ncbi:MAG: ORF6N domain-containing protein [Bacteroides sp.]|nr:ORF6N domain-containing protein [Bacteroides sp.]